MAKKLKAHFHSGSNRRSPALIRLFDEWTFSVVSDSHSLYWQKNL